MASLKDIGPIYLNFTATTSAKPGTVTTNYQQPEPLKAARAHVDALLTGQEVLSERLRAMRTLFGPAVYHALDEAVQRVVGSGLDAATEFERKVIDDEAALRAAVSERIDGVATAQDVARAQQERATAEIDRLTMLLRFAVDDVTDRYKRSKRPEPAWLADACAAVEPVLS